MCVEKETEHADASIRGKRNNCKIRKKKGTAENCHIFMGIRKGAGMDEKAIQNVDRKVMTKRVTFPKGCRREQMLLESCSRSSRLQPRQRSPIAEERKSGGHLGTKHDSARHQTHVTVAGGVVGKDEKSAGSEKKFLGGKKKTDWKQKLDERYHNRGLKL